MRLLLMILLALPMTTHAQDLRQSLIGTWSGDGSVQIRPTSKAKATTCDARFSQVEGFWLGGSLSCKKGRGRDMVQLRFATPDTRGRMQVDLFDDDGDAIVSMAGQLTDEQLTLFHPDILEFGGTEYQPVLLFSVGGSNQLQVQQLGVPTRSDASRYTMSDILFDRIK